MRMRVNDSNPHSCLCGCVAKKNNIAWSVLYYISVSVQHVLCMHARVFVCVCSSPVSSRAAQGSMGNEFLQTVAACWAKLRRQETIRQARMSCWVRLTLRKHFASPTVYPSIHSSLIATIFDLIIYLLNNACGDKMPRLPKRWHWQMTKQQTSLS